MNKQRANVFWKISLHCFDRIKGSSIPEIWERDSWNYLFHLAEAGNL